MSPAIPLPAPLDEGRVRARIALLPTLPPLVMELLSSFQQEDLNVTALAERIGNEQTLAARVLRIANSPFYGLSGRVASIHDAVVILGFRAVRSLVLAAAMVGAFPAQLGRHFSPRTFWRHSVATALAARGLARLRGENPETAFSAGLLHDLGRVFLAVAFPDHFAALLRWQTEHDRPNREAEQAVLGLDHGTAGRLLAEQWGLPLPIGEAIARHHEPDREPPNPLVDLVHGADLIALALELDGRENSAVPPPSPGAWARLDLDQASLISLFGEVDENFQETCHALLP